MKTRSPARNRALLGAIAIGALIAARRPRKSQGRSLVARGRAVFLAVTGWLDRRWGWDRSPFLLGVLTLIGIRERLRDQNFYATWDEAAPPPSPPAGSRHLTARTMDGSYNNLARPQAGMIGTRLARNVPLERTFPEPEPKILTPNPRVVSRVLMTRDQFIPATTINMLAAAWLQFMIHGFFTHGKNDKAGPWSIELADDDTWPHRPMTILRTRADPTRTEAERDVPPTYINRTTHWWDAAQIYGDDPALCAKLRTGERGTLLMGDDGLLPLDPETGLDNEYGVNVTGVSGNWWIGLSLLHTLFTREHNAICDHLHAAYPSWSDDDLYDHARLINAALMAKIFMVDWAPMLTAHPVAAFAARAAWWGLAGERIHHRFGRISRNPIVSGIPGGPLRADAVRYAITEEFVAIYRMHQFLPDTFCFRSATNNKSLREVNFPDVAFRQSRVIEEQIPMSDLFYSFGTMHPGALTLHNYPRFLQQLNEPDGTTVDLAATDVMRTRERGVPRYNEFRQLIGRPPVRTFEELCENPTWREELRSVYADVDEVDLLVGLYAELPPRGLALADTSYRVFVLMTSIRLEADRFFTVDYRPEVYSPEGLEWIEYNDMRSVLLRHYPELRASLHGVKNPFAPWPHAA